MPRRTTAALLAALTVTLASGCTAGDEPAAGPPAPAAIGEPWYDEITAAEADGEVGRAGTPCPLPVAFPLAKGWRAEAVELPAAAPTGGPEAELGAEIAAALGRRGGATARCEIDGRRAGGGFVRVWAADQPATAPRAALEAFVAGTEDDVTGQQSREVRAGGFDAVEATWVQTSELLGEADRSWALAVRADEATFLFTTSESLIAERTDVLPAYRLAVGGLTAAG